MPCWSSIVENHFAVWLAASRWSTVCIVQQCYSVTVWLVDSVIVWQKVCGVAVPRLSGSVTDHWTRQLYRFRDLLNTYLLIYRFTYLQITENRYHLLFTLYGLRFKVTVKGLLLRVRVCSRQLKKLCKIVGNLLAKVVLLQNWSSRVMLWWLDVYALDMQCNLAVFECVNPSLLYNASKENQA